MLSDILNEKYISTAITIMVGLYAASIGPELPPFVKDLFSNSIFKIIVLFLVVVRANKNPTMSLVIAIAFVLTLEHFQKAESINAFTSVGYKLGENVCEEEPERVENPIQLEQHMQYLDVIDNMANVSYLENELDDDVNFEDFTDVDYVINTNSDINTMESEEMASAISPLQLQKHFEYLDEIENMTNGNDEFSEDDNMSNVESFASM
jgi:hypothetical protein